jgi:hypothetical protein
MLNVSKEYMHTLGLVDLYDGVDALEASGIGAFDIMVSLTLRAIPEWLSVTIQRLTFFIFLLSLTPTARMMIRTDLGI